MSGIGPKVVGHLLVFVRQLAKELFRNQQCILRLVKLLGVHRNSVLASQFQLEPQFFRVPVPAGTGTLLFSGSQNSKRFCVQQKFTVGRNLDYTRKIYTINTSLWHLTFINLFILTFANSLLDDLKCLPVWQQTIIVEVKSVM